MNKFLLSIILLASAAVAQADVILETTLKEGDKEAVSQAVVLSQSVTQAEFTLNDVTYKVVVTKMVNNEDGTFIFAVDVFKIVDGQEVLVIQPEFSNLPATLTIGNDSTTFTFVVNEVEQAQEVATN